MLDSAMPWTIAHQAPLSTGFSWQEYWKVKVKSLSRVWLYVTPWAIVCQAPPSKGFCRQEYWSGLLFPSPGSSSPREWSQVPCMPAHSVLCEPPGKLLKVLVAQSCLALCDPVDCSSPGSSVHGILQERILEWVAIPFSRGSSPPRDRTRVSCIPGRCFNLWASSITKATHNFP